MIRYSLWLMMHFRLVEKETVRRRNSTGLFHQSAVIDGDRVADAQFSDSEGLVKPGQGRQIGAVHRIEMRDRVGLEIFDRAFH